MLVTRIDSRWRNVLRGVPTGVIFYPSGLKLDKSTIYDFSGNGSHGTITGAVPIRTPGGLWGLNFSGGDDSVDFGDPASLNITTTLSVFIWHKNAVADLTAFNTLFSKYNIVGNLREWNFGLNAAEKIAFGASDDGTSNALNFMDITSDAAVTPNVWNLYGLTFNAGTVVMSLNGASVAFTNAGAAITSLFNGTGKLIMGNTDGGTNWLYGDATLGLIANVVLSPAWASWWMQRTNPLFGV